MPTLELFLQRTCDSPSSGKTLWATKAPPSTCAAFISNGGRSKSGPSSQRDRIKGWEVHLQVLQQVVSKICQLDPAPEDAHRGTAVQVQVL